MTDGQGAFRYIGRPRRTKEDGRFVAGRGRYVADIRLPGMKHVALVSSPHASARILSIDTRAALATEGVSGRCPDWFTNVGARRDHQRGRSR
jgi:CO/xanthine dehydrogenase Mo-binding subunit